MPACLPQNRKDEQLLKRRNIPVGDDEMQMLPALGLDSSLETLVQVGRELAVSIPSWLQLYPSSHRKHRAQMLTCSSLQYKQQGKPLQSLRWYSSHLHMSIPLAGRCSPKTRTLQLMS